MTRLSYIRFVRQQKFTLDGETSTEVNTDRHGELFKDGDTFRVGKDCFSIAAVDKWIEMTPAEQGGETCPECSGWFQDARALGAHRRFKHNVAGARSKDGE